LVLDTAQRTGHIQITKIALLSDRTHRIESNGKLKTENNNIPFKNYCAFIIRNAAEYRGVDPELVFSDNGWNEMQVALKVRHRITHPKRPEDLEVTDAELHSISEGHRWLVNCMILIMRSAPPRPENKEQP